MDAFYKRQKLDLAIILLGPLITVDSMFRKKHRVWRMFILILGAWTLWFLIGLQMGHAIGVVEFRMNVTAILETAICNIMSILHIPELERW